MLEAYEEMGRGKASHEGNLLGPCLVFHKGS